MSSLNLRLCHPIQSNYLHSRLQLEVLPFLVENFLRSRHTIGGVK
ncbi:hypothetical protein [Oculatella sp. FACHB-28]|nr:hypothetical protein [Oculatella sp. FACHB-28]